MKVVLLMRERSLGKSMDSKPDFRRENDEELTLRASPAALAVEREHLTRIGSGTPFQVKEPAVLHAEAKRRVAAGGGDSHDNQLVASESAIQFGQYRGKSFKWLLENDLGYAVMVLSGHQKARESGDLSDTALMTNKDAFLRYARFYPEVAKAIRQRSTLADDCLVGFGAHKMCTYKELYESTDREKKSYVGWLRQARCRVGGIIHAMKRELKRLDKKNKRKSKFSHPHWPPVIFTREMKSRKKLTRELARDAAAQASKPDPPTPKTVLHRLGSGQGPSGGPQSLKISPFQPRQKVQHGGTVTTDSHQLYGLFIAKLSACIFEWDAADVACLREAVEAEKQGIVGLTEEQLNSKLTPKLLTHTHGAQETEELIGQLLAAFHRVTDTMGIPLLDAERVGAIWETQRQHLSCVQDPPGLQLHTKTGQVTRGGVILPVYRCARGCTSLESFHLHLNHFIPGTSANAENLQAYLLEGLVRIARQQRQTRQVCCGATAATCSTASNCSAASLLRTAPSLGSTQDNYRSVSGELIGVEYLYSQQCRELREDIGRDPDAPDGDPDDEPEREEEPLPSSYLGDEGDPTFAPLTATDPRHGLPVARAEPEAPPSRALSVNAPSAPAPPPSAGVTSGVDDADVFRGPDGALGYDRVVRLARHLVELRDEPCVSERHVADILFAGPGPGPGHRARAQGQGTGPAQWPHASRLVEAICLELCAIHPRGQKIAGVKVNRWAVILHDYGRIRRMVLNSPALMEATALQLFEINQRTLSVWHNLQKKQELAALAMEISVPDRG
ncbi:hypothetical protein NFI96_005935 [Prochilodus magdalenae]|nr:hypothetical protein NFI96_005935 [Prochilodus magdalenae]